MIDNLVKISFLKIIFFIFCISSANYIAAQKIDSLFNKLKNATYSEKIDIYTKISKYYLNSNSNLARVYAKKGLNIAKNKNKHKALLNFYLIISNTFEKENKNDTAIFYIDSALNIVKNNEKSKKASLLYQKGKIYYQKENYNIAEKFFNKSNNLYKKLKDTTSLIATNERLGMSFYMRSNYAKAIEYFMIELKLAEKNNYIEAQASSKNNIAMTYATDKDYENSLKYYKEAEQIYKDLENIRGLATVFNNIGNIYTDLNSPDSALFYFKKALKYSSFLDDKIFYSICQTNIAEIYIKKKNFSDAELLLKQSKKVFEKYQMLSYLSAVYHLYGNLNIGKKRFTIAKDNYILSLKFAKKTNNKELEKENYAKLSELFNIINDYKNAFFYHKKYTKLKDSLYNIENSLKINQLKLNYETEKKDKEIKLNQLKIKRQKKLLLFFEISFAIFIFLITIAIIFYRKLNKSHKKLVEKNLELVENNEELNQQKETVKDNIKQNNFDNQKLNEYIGLKNYQIEELEKGLEKFISDKIFMQDDISLDKMSKMLNTNKLYLSRFINLKYNKNFNTYINSFRIQEAQKILKSADYKNYTLDAIANMVGFKSRSSFYSVFKKITGVTPSFFKKQVKSKS